jgi:hypothetical protein
LAAFASSSYLISFAKIGLWLKGSIGSLRVNKCCSSSLVSYRGASFFLVLSAALALPTAD